MIYEYATDFSYFLDRMKKAYSQVSVSSLYLVTHTSITNPFVASTQ